MTALEVVFGRGSTGDIRGGSRDMGLSQGKRTLVQRLRSSRFRPREKLFLVEGVKGGREVLEATLPLRVRFALTSPRLEATQGGRDLRAALAPGSFPAEEISDQELRELSDTQEPQGMIMVVEEPQLSLVTFESIPGPRLLVLDGIQDPGNAGTLIRTARALGMNGVIFLEGTVDPWNPKVIRSAAGSFAHTPVIRTSWSDAAGWIEDRSIPLFVADPGGEDVRGFSPDPPWALVVGNEGAGTREELRARAQKILAISMVPGADSLNAAVAGAILLFSMSGSLETESED